MADNFKLELPGFLLTKLRCSKCKGYLSVPPISGNKGYYQCGRCNPNCENIDLFEELAKYAEFPCSNEGCTEKLKWGRAKNHESQCPYKKIDCIFPDCMEKTTIRLIKGHFELFHDNYIHYDHLSSVPVRLKDVGQCKDYVHILIQNATFSISLVLVRLSHYFEGNNLRYACSIGLFSLSSPKPCSPWKWYTTLKVSSVTEEMTVQKNHYSVPFDANNHCFQCLDGDCTADGHSHLQDFLPVKFSGLDHRNNSHVSYMIRIDQPSEEIPKGASIAGAQTLECPVCNMYMCRPIFNCPKGHSICNGCRRKITICPYCKTGMGDSRNYALEGLAETLELPCVNSNVGCYVIGIASVMNDHIQKCNKVA